MRALTTVTLAAALTLSLSLGACASRRPLPTRADPANAASTDPLGAGGAAQPGAGGQAGMGAQPGGAMGPGPGGAGAGGTAPGSMQAFVIEAGDRVFFDTDSHNLHSQAVNTLTAQAAWLNRWSAVRVM